MEIAWAAVEGLPPPLGFPSPLGASGIAVGPASRCNDFVTLPDLADLKHILRSIYIVFFKKIFIYLKE